jgi:uncharacterized protein (TIGR02117 family)
VPFNRGSVKPRCTVWWRARNIVSGFSDSPIAYRMITLRPHSADAGRCGVMDLRRVRLATLLLGLIAMGTPGCVWTPIKPYYGAAPKTQTLFVMASNWHTQVGLPAGAITAPLSTLKHRFPKARLLMFGWGARDFYMARHATFKAAMRALFPTSSVMLVMGINNASQRRFFKGAHRVPVRVSRAGMHRLSRYLWRYLDKVRPGIPRRIAAGPYPTSAFYASAATYDAFHTCNAWTAEALHVAGLPVRAGGVLFAGQVIDQVRPLRRTPTHGVFATTRR